MLHPMNRARYRCAVLALACAVCLMMAQGCRNQKDAEAAAAQMATTAKVLQAYYGVLDRTLEEWQDAYEAQHTIDHTQPQDLKELREQMRHRAAVAEEIGDLAGVFQKLTGSKAAGEASEAAGKLNEEAVSLAGITGNSAQADAVTTGIKVIVQLIQQHDEKRAAEKMAPLCGDLAAFFESEKKRYVSIDRDYYATARNVARTMVKRNQVDPGAVFVSSLHPFGLAPQIEDAGLRQSLQPYLLTQIDARRDAKVKEAEAAADALDESLQEMKLRVDRVAEGKAMPSRVEPFSLETVQTWIEQVSK